jgi:PAS domain S-box-containing protein
MKEIIENADFMKTANNDSHKYLQNIYQNTPSLVFVLSNNNELLFASSGLKGVLGYKAEDLLGADFIQFVHPDDCDRVKADIDNSFRIVSNMKVMDDHDLNDDIVSEAISKDQLETFLQSYFNKLKRLSAIKPSMYRFRRKTGSWCWLESICMPSFVKSNSGIMLTIFSHDVTERVKLQDLLKVNLRKLSKKIRYETIIRNITQDVHKSINIKEVFENAVDAIHKNVLGATNVSIYIIEDGNAVIKAYRGYSDRFIDRIKIIPYPKDYTWKTIINEKFIYCADVDRDTLVGRVGREIGIKSYLSMPIHSRNSVLGVINISSNKKDIFDKDELILLELIAQQIESAINNARKAEELKKSEQRFRNLFENVPTGMYRFTPDGYILDANPAFIDMLGFSSIDELAVHEIECRNLRLGVNWKKVKKTMEGDGEIKGLESAWNRRDGTKIFVLENIRAIRGSDGSILFYEGSVEDITERKVAENKLKEVNLNLEKEIRRRTAQLIKANECLRKEISERKLKEEELNRSYNQLRALTKHLESVREEERAKISREVHDELGQSLTGLKIDLDFLSKQLCESGDNRENAKLMEVIRNMASLVDYNIQSVRRIAIELRPSVLDDLGIVAVIEWQLQDFEKRTGIKCSFICGVEDIPLDREVSTALYRIFKEVITNVARHSKATTVTVRLREYRSKCLLVIEDNGVGISDDQIVAPQSLGLLGIKERASSIGGDVRITSKFNGGAKITVMVPK